MLKVIRQNTRIIDHDSRSIIEVVSVSRKMLFDGEIVAMIRSEYLTKKGELVTAYETPWMGEDYVQEIDDYYSDPKHAYDTLEECIEYLKETTSWI